MPYAHAVVVATALVIAVNWLANALPLNGRTTGEVSALYQSPFTPAGYVFGIWGLIYAGLFGYSLWQWRRARCGDRRLEVLGPAYLASCVANVAWIVCWHWLRIGASLVAMAALLAALLAAWRQLRRLPAAGTAERVLVHGSITLYLAWICIACIANLAAWIVSSGGAVSGLPPVALAIAFVLAAALLFLAWTVRGRVLIPGLVFLWAALGIAWREGQAEPVAIAAWVGIGLVAGALASVLLRWAPART